MHKFLPAVLLSALCLGIVGAPARAEEAKKFDYDWAYDPITHEPILVCVDCWFWSCDCGSN